MSTAVCNAEGCCMLKMDSSLQNSSIPAERKKVLSAIKAVKALHEKHFEENPKKKPLLEDVQGTALLLQLTLKKIPYCQNVQMIKIPLPHSLVTETTDICLITGDLDKRDRKADIEPTVLHYKELLQKHGVKFISEVIPLRQLRTDYKPHEAKRQLVAGYDIFLTEDKIAGCLPKVLGKFFFKKRKFPQQVSLSGNLKQNLEKAVSRTVLFLSGRGATCCFTVARLNWPVEKIADNVMAAVSVLMEKLPGSFPNVNGLYLKTEKSLAVPIYISFESRNNVQLPQGVGEQDAEPEEITTLTKTKVKIFPSGSIKLVPNESYEPSESENEYEDRLLSTEGHKKRKLASKARFKKRSKNTKRIKK